MGLLAKIKGFFVKKQEPITAPTVIEEKPQPVVEEVKLPPPLPEVIVAPAVAVDNPPVVVIPVEPAPIGEKVWPYVDQVSQPVEELPKPKKTRKPRKSRK